MNDEMVNKLSMCHLFEGIPLAELRGLLDLHRCPYRDYHKGAVVAFRGDLYDHLYIILEGNVTAQFEDYNGKVLKVETLAPTDPIATAILFAPDSLLPVTLTADSDVRLCSIPRGDVLRLMQKNERFLLNYLQDSGLRLSVLAEKLRLIQFSTIREKIASYLLDQADKQSTDSPRLHVSKETMAEIFGVSRPSLSREFSRMEEEGLLLREGHRIHILSRSSLEDILESIGED